MKNGHLWKRMLSLLLTAVMVFALLPGAAVHVHAEDHNCWGEYEKDSGDYDDVNHFITCDTCGEGYAESHYDENGDDCCDVCTGKMHLEHTFVNGNLEFDEDYHYVVCDGIGCGEPKEGTEEEHVYDDEYGMVCGVCGYNRCQHDAPYVAVVGSGDDQGHWIVCSGCNDVDGTRDWGAHYDTDENGQCDGCHYWFNCPHTNVEWDEENPVDAEEHRVICSDCKAAYWEAHYDGDDDDTQCDVCSYKLCAHSVITWQWDVNEHWKRCEGCSTRWEKQAHTYEAGEGKCSECGRPCVHEDAVWDEQPGEANGHRTICQRCGAATIKSHAIDDKTGLCTVCGYEGCIHTNMEWNGETRDSVEHWMVCADCGEMSYWEAHDMGEDGICTVCGYWPNCPHASMEWDGETWDSVDHWMVCADCGEGIHWEAHDMGEGGLCTVCGYECEHELYDAATSNGDGTHSGECDYCGLRVTLACYGYDGPYTDNDHRLLCEVCGYLDAVSVEHTFEDGYLHYDDVMHYPECDGCLYHLSEGEYHSFAEGRYSDATKAAHLIYCDAVSCGYAFWQAHHDTNEDGLCDICGTDVEEMLFDVYVGGVGLTDGDYLAVEAAEATTDRPDGGYAHYADGVLTLHDYFYEGYGVEWAEATYAAVYAVQSMTIVLEGENTLICLCDEEDEYSDGIAAQRDLTIEGEGSLYMESEEDGIDANGDIQMNSGDLTICTVEDDGFDSAASVRISGGTVDIVSGDHGLDISDTLTISGGTINIEAGDDGMDVENGIEITGGTIVIDAADNGIDGNDHPISIRDCTLEIVTENANGIETEADVTIADCTVVMEVGNYAVCAGTAAIEDGSVTACQCVMVPDGVKVIIAAVYQDYRMVDVTLDTDFSDGLSIPVFVPWDGWMEAFHLDAGYAPFGSIS